MRMLSACFWFSMVMLLVGCGTQRTGWPAQITSIEGFSETERQQMVASLTRMNASNDKPLVVLEGTPAPTTYLIHIQRHEAWPDLTAGMTQKGAETCSVDISTELFKSDRESYMDSVVWHELGHCAGLNHNPNKGTMMYAIAKPFSTLATSAVKDFFIDMEKSLWSEPLGH